MEVESNDQTAATSALVAPDILVTSASSRSRFWPMRRRSVIELTGSFLFISTLAIIGGTLQATEVHTNTTGTDHTNTALGLQVIHSETSAPPGTLLSATTTHTLSSPDETDFSTTTSGSSQNIPNSDTTTTTTSNSASNGTSTTQLTVNGQPISLPSNGSITHTISTPGGTVNVSSTSSQVGTSSDSSSSDVNVNISN